jgi:ADP-heptose:LPS heptosyltransferase
VTPEYAAERLLELGPLSPESFRDITGWPFEQSERVIRDLTQSGVVTILHGGPGAINQHTVTYWLTRLIPARRAPRLRLVA